MTLIDPKAIRNGDRLALSRALTAIENNTAESKSLQAALFPFTGNAHLVGVTGAPGSGKSTLVNQLAKTIRQSDHEENPPKIAIVAVDPTSPFSGGALLGDRIRMQDLSGDQGIFIRSMASHGALGGLAHNTAAFATLLDGAGFDVIIIETVGAGQAEVDIARLAHTVIVVEAPGMGDDIQAIKAGILEIADILVVNKADRPEAENTARALKIMLEMGRGGERMPLAGKHLMRSIVDKGDTPKQADQKHGWETPVRLVTAVEGSGIDTLVDDIRQHRDYLESSNLWKSKEAYRLEKDLEALIRDKLLAQWQESLDEEKYQKVLSEIIQRKRSPIEALDLLL
ncbi:MAG: methylmalonyl Co-A mutase-associated GTPase MeaB [Chloroflexota bacterium]|nr:methylmalonyl Co-A mutase-associated GTPase MeaB [Chloroflexota bacterium]